MAPTAPSDSGFLAQFWSLIRIPMSTAPTKSALPKIGLTGAAPPSPPPVKPVNAGIVSMQIELLASVRDEPDKHGVGYCYFSRGKFTENALSMILNRNRLVVSKALIKADAVTVSFLFGILLAECCALRR